MGPRFSAGISARLFGILKYGDCPSVPPVSSSHSSYTLRYCRFSNIGLAGVVAGGGSDDVVGVAIGVGKKKRREKKQIENKEGLSSSSLRYATGRFAL